MELGEDVESGGDSIRALFPLTTLKLVLAGALLPTFWKSFPDATPSELPKARTAFPAATPAELPKDRKAFLVPTPEVLPKFWKL